MRLTKLKTTEDLEEDKRKEQELLKVLFPGSTEEERSRMKTTVYHSKYKLADELNSHPLEMALEKLGKIEDLEEVIDFRNEFDLIDFLEYIAKLQNINKH